MAESARERKVAELRFVLENEGLAPVIYAHGAYGGVGPRGEVVVNFYVESWAQPTEGTVTIYEDGTAREEAKKPDRLRRTVVARVFLPAEPARAIGEWLQQSAERARQASQETDGTRFEGRA
ncbi:hypothetical protein DYI95_003580 [Thermaerobacter sp. PB12/4term]|uniref:hypothetical protein n=1 Tax=Thermaerobacter sp. PB12/4term TaxID=2293838 RepID=UPI0011C02784|nr:hypothetical protein [Thermaerobacter sp. PB12/4term]QIA26721.1 hypothetical protein DYI95_003580 [Thermaerobacter sp. PB12/4term]